MPGAAAYGPSVNVTVAYVGEGFGMPERAGALADELRSEGVDDYTTNPGGASSGQRSKNFPALARGECQGTRLSFTGEPGTRY